MSVGLRAKAVRALEREEQLMREEDERAFLERWSFVPGDQTMLLANAQADQAREGQRRRAIELPDDVFERLPLERQEQIYAMGRERK